MKAKIVLLLAFSISIGINLSFGQTLQEFFSIGSNTFFDEAVLETGGPTNICCYWTETVT